MEKNISFEDIFHCTCNGMVVTDINGTITHMNQSAVSALELGEKLHCGQSIIDVLPQVGEPLHKCMRTGEAVIGHVVAGKRTEFVVNVTPVLRSEQILGAVCNIEELDVFEASAKKTLSYRTLYRQLETIFQSSSDGIWVCDGVGKVIGINRASEVLNGLKASEVIGYSINELLGDKIFDESVTTKVMESRQRETVIQYISKTNRYLLSTGTPSLDESGKIVLIVVNERDMTELNTLRRKFEKSQRVKEKYREELSELSLLELQRNSIIAESGRMRQVLKRSLKLSHIGASNILILGESGTGKGLIAKLIHKNSSRHKKPFVEINCAALPENLLEAELFGYERGAFTGAGDKGKVGLFELAQGGTIFLDEMGDMPLALQVKILKYLDNYEIRRVGGTESIKISCATIAATNQNLSDLVAKKLFREDLYYRLSSFIVELPPLRHRVEDILGLVRFYLHEFNTKYKCNKTITPRVAGFLQTYSFPGNIRELKSIVENAVVMCDNDNVDDFIRASVSMPDPVEAREEEGWQNTTTFNLSARLAQVEKQLLSEAKKRYGTTREMAAQLGVSQPSVVRKLRKHNIR